MPTWVTRSRRTLLDCGRFLTVELHEVVLPDGRVIADWPWVISPDYVNVVAVDDQGRALVFRQHKYAVQGSSLAAVGGYVEPGEDPLSSAKRELLEETGHAAAEWVPLGSYPVDGNRGVGTAHFFLARGAYPVSDVGGDDLEEQELLALSVDELAAALDEGAFKLLPWAAIVALALRRLA